MHLHNHKEAEEKHNDDKHPLLQWNRHWLSGEEEEKSRFRKCLVVFSRLASSFRVFFFWASDM